jgi:inner membrane protein
MPSPVGHSLIGLAIGCAWLLKPAPLRALAREAWARRWPLLGAMAVANAPDLDYVPGLVTGDLNAYHHAYTHTIAWTALVTAALWLAWRSTGRRAGWSLFILLFALGCSHLAADWMTDDGRAPYGIMAWWPISDERMISPSPVFMRLHKRAWSEFLQWHNVEAVAVEIAICLPLVALALACKLRSAGRLDRAAAGGHEPVA